MFKTVGGQPPPFRAAPPAIQPASQPAGQPASRPKYIKNPSKIHQKSIKKPVKKSIKIHPKSNKNPSKIRKFAKILKSHNPLFYLGKRGGYEISGFWQISGFLTDFCWILDGF